MEEFKPFPVEYFKEINANPNANYFTPVLERTIHLLNRAGSQPKNVLDVGCGNGIFSRCLKEAWQASLHGVDGSSYAIENARNIGFDQVIKVNDFSNDPLPYKNGQFEFVLCKDVLEHLLHPDYLMSEISRVTAKGGHFLCHVPNHFPLVGRIRFLFRRNIDTFKYFPGAERWNYPHIRFFDHESMTALGALNKLEPIACLSENFVRLSILSKIIPKKIISFLVHRFPDELAAGVTILFRKV